MEQLSIRNIKITTFKSRFVKARVSCFYESEVLNSNFAHLIKFSAKNTPTSPSPKTLGPSKTRNKYDRITRKNRIISKFTG